jgi:hypothetical protein
VNQISDWKQREETLTPLLLFECQPAEGTEELWCTHAVRAEGKAYEGRVLRHSGFEMRLGAEDGLDNGSRLTLTLANVDGRISQIDANPGWRGARLRVRFGFFDLTTGEPASELVTVFLGLANPAEEITERDARLSFVNRLSLQRVQAPQLRIQARCPWRFPSTREQREEALEGGAEGRYSHFYRCGYSPDVEGGCGNLNGDEPYTDCNYTREDCQQRGMFEKDSQNRPTARFGGFAFLPAGLLTKAHGTRDAQWSEPLDGRARPNDAVPVIYGTAWIQAPVIFARNDGNLTHCEALVGMGPIEGVRKVIANGVEIPQADDGRDMSGTGWYRLLTRGERNGGFNTGFADSEGRPMGDPHGSLACLSVVLPNAIVDRGKLPRIEVLADGLRLERYDAQGQVIDASFTRNPAWILLDLFRSAGWRKEEIDFASFAATAQYCDEFVTVAGPDGEPLQGPRFEVNAALTRRRSLSETVKGIRSASGLMLSFDAEGKLSLRPEATLERQHPAKAPSSNASAPMHGGWPAYEFGDGSNGVSGILLRRGGESTFRVYRRSSGEAPNRLTVEYTNAFRDYAPESLSFVDYEDARLQGCEVSAAHSALGLPHFDQAARILRLQLEKNLRGNQYVEFETTVQAFGLRPGDIITITHLRSGFDRTPFRVLKVAAGLNFETARITAQRHEDAWYERVAAEKPFEGAEILQNGGVPLSLAGKARNASGEEEFEFEEAEAGGEGNVEVTVRFTAPPKPGIGAPRVPSVDLVPRIRSGEGTLAGGRTWYYAVSAVNATGQESKGSFVVEARLSGGAEGYAVELKGIRTGADAAGIRVYRGESPFRLRRIAEVSPVPTEFVDAGLSASLTPVPDPNFDHARFQWRFEYLPPTATDSAAAAMIGNSTLGMQPDEYRGRVVRIISGKGAGQERQVTHNTETEIHVSPPWNVAPDTTSIFAVSETGWRPGGLTRSDEIRFVVPAGYGGAIQVMGVAVSGRGAESPEAEALVGRHELGLAGAGDRDVPPMPGFGLTAHGQGGFVISGIGFPTLENTRTIRTGSLVVHYWDELKSPCPWRLGAAMDAAAVVLEASSPMPAAQGDLVQVEQELMRVLEVWDAGARLLVDRGVHDTEAVIHTAGTPVYLLERHTSVMAFSKGFFGSPASGSYSRRVDLKNARIAAGEYYVTNDRGSSPTAYQAYTATAEGGLRTMVGGQYTFQFDSELAVAAHISPPIIVESTRAVRDVQAHVDQPPAGEPVLIRVSVDDEPYADLVVQPGFRDSEAVNCFDRLPLTEGARVTASILAVGTGVNSYPGRGLTVTLRL